MFSKQATPLLASMVSLESRYILINPNNTVDCKYGTALSIFAPDVFYNLKPLLAIKINTVGAKVVITFHSGNISDVVHKYIQIIGHAAHARIRVKHM